MDPRSAVLFLREGGCRFAVVDSRHVASFAEEATRVGLDYVRSAQVAGLNIGNVRPISLLIYRSAKEGSAQP